MQRVRKKNPPDDEVLLREKGDKNNDNLNDSDSNDDEFRALYLDKEKEKEYVFNPKETNAFEAQNEFEGSGEYSVNLSKDHTNHFNEEAEQSFFRKLLNIFFTQKLLAVLTALLIKLATIVESMTASLNLRSKTKYKVISSLLKLLIKMQMLLSLRLMQMLLLLNKKLIEFDKKYLGGSGASREKQGEIKNLGNNQERQKEREQYRSLEIGNLEEQRRSEYLRDKAFNQNRENLVAQEKNEWQKYQDLSKSLTKNIESRVELSKSNSISSEKDPIKKSEDFAAKMYYLKFNSDLNAGKEGFSLEGSLLSKLLGVARVVYNTAKDMARDFYKNTMSEYNKFDSKNTSRNEFMSGPTISYFRNADQYQSQNQNQNQENVKNNDHSRPNVVQFEDLERVQQRGENRFEGF